jgi:transcriptional regulator GlxA family with amidase domain
MRVTVLVPGSGFPSTVIGPVEVFSNTGLIWNALVGDQTETPFQVETASEDGKPVRYDGGVTIVVDKSVADVDDTDLVFVSTIGLDTDRVVAESPGMLDLVRRHAGRGTVVAGVCSGVAMLAEAGVLNGRPATTHWALAERFRRKYPNVNWQPQQFITESDNIYCGGGVYAALDLCLHLVERMAGYEAARQCGRAMLIDTPRTWQASFSAPAIKKPHADPQICRAEAILHERFREPLTVEDLARELGMSSRNFARRFKRATGESPLAYLHQLRIDCAKHLLETDFISVQEVCFKVGYEDVPHFRNLFKRHTGLGPSDYKSRFGSRCDVSHAVLNA